MNFLLVLLACVAAINAQSLVIHNLQGVPISVTKIGNGRVQSGTVKMFHPINLTSIEETVEALLSIAKPEVGLDTQLSYTLELKIDELKRTFSSLKPKSSRQTRSKRWDRLGKAWKWLAGSPDADDLRVLKKTIHELAAENNAQVRINLAINNKLDQTIDMINSMMYIHKSLSQREQLDISVVNMILTIDTLVRHLDEIREGITKARFQMIHQPLVSEEELMNIVEILISEGIELHVNSEALQYVEAKVVSNEQTLLYIISTPKLLETKYEVVRVIPLVTDNEIMKLPGEYFLTSKSETLLILVVPPLKPIYQLNQLKNITYDSCIHNLIKSKHGSCEYQQTPQWEHIIEVTQALVLVNDGKVHLDNTCGVENRDLVGHYLIEFSNCSITIDGHHFSNTVLKSKETPLFPAIHSLGINRSLTPAVFNVRELSKLQVETRRQLEYLEEVHKESSWKLWGGFSTSVILAVVVGIMFLWKICSTGCYGKVSRTTVEQVEISRTVCKACKYPKGNHKPDPGCIAHDREPAVLVSELDVNWDGNSVGNIN